MNKKQGDQIQLSPRKKKNCRKRKMDSELANLLQQSKDCVKKIGKSSIRQETFSSV